MITLHPSSVCDVQKNENIQPAATNLSASNLIIPVSLALTERRIFAYVEIAQAAPSAYELYGTVELVNSSRSVGVFPLEFSGNAGTNPNKSLCCAFNAGGSPVGDSWVLRLASAFDVNFPSIVLQPLRLTGEIDRIKLTVNRVIGAYTGIRTFIACISTKY